MNTPIRLAFIGVDHPHGAHWRELLRNFNEQLKITASVPEFGGALTSLEEIYADLPRFRSVEHLIADAAADFDAAVVCLPNNQGPAAVTALANAGKHILCEKPVGRNAAEIRQMAEVLLQSGVAFQNGFVWRYDDAANRLRNMVQEGRFGKLFSVEMTYVTSDVIRRGPNHYLFDAEVSGGGFFSWLACHHLDRCKWSRHGIREEVPSVNGMESQVWDEHGWKPKRKLDRDCRSPPTLARTSGPADTPERYAQSTLSLSQNRTHYRPESSTHQPPSCWPDTNAWLQ